MAIEEHLVELGKGVAKWNEWRMKHWNENLRPNLSDVDLQGTNLSGANFGLVDFTNANLSNSILVGSYFLGANLSDAKLMQARCKGAYFSDAILKRTDFSSAWLFSADFSRADLTEACLENADLRAIRAIDAKFCHTKLTGACIQNWYISVTHLDDVICEYIYLKGEWSNQEQKYLLSDRRPSDPNRIFAPSEFAKLFQKALETVDLIFADGIDWKAFFQSFQELRSQYGDENLAIQAIEKKSGGAFVIRLEVPAEADKAAIESQAKELYEKDLRLLGERVAEYKDEVRFLRQSNTNLERIVGIMSDNQPTHQTIIQNPGHIAALNTGSGTISHVTQNIGQNLAEITKLITTLRETAQAFPAEQREEVLGHLDDLQEDLSKPERQEPSRIKRRLKALMAIAIITAGAIDFTNNLTDLAEKLGVPIELSQSQTPQQLPSGDGR